RVVLTFSEPVTPLAFRLLRPDGEIVRLPDARADGATIEAPLALEGVTGTAILNWRVASADGHPVGGSITFTIGAGTEPAQELAWSTYRAPSWAARFILMVALFASVGAVLFRYWVFAAERRGDMRLSAGAAGLGALSLAAFVYAQAVDVTGLGASGLRASDVWNALLVNGFGLGAGLAACALLLALICAIGGVGRAAGRFLSAAAAAA
ncbi:copper resistance protein CopC, partial [Hansschlegelia beijingensis]|uniref:copper resistance CopC family protein n=1 Tax=Hansschlegelia beijingensis TaxID=1133344 RepID=UPI00387F26C4